MFTNSYDILSRLTLLPTKIGTTNDFSNTYAYHANGQVPPIVQQGGGLSKQATYTYSAVGQPTMKTGYASIGATSKVYDTNYSYDGMRRLLISNIKTEVRFLPTMILVETPQAASRILISHRSAIQPKRWMMFTITPTS
jgi:hypothetical protein